MGAAGVPRKAGLPLIGGAERRIWSGMKRIFDMDDRARLPWRFYGAAHSVLARP
ncbi:hypothetical protein NHN26_12160 [Rhodovulum tesquicola]|uniref:Uncharacterized protein n=1 Tax=Rhodovulum steppense TaxID=540251 RepID=A0A4R1YL92_9RHOB|nr:MULTISPECIES: hypothetical protein [Rhodovulum]MCO8145978.1 hypothetical protein [Rhodovulum tesquicola]TCM77802.1 hypothetical protein EV216_12811 [Rhodovulum steppense]